VRRNGATAMTDRIELVVATIGGPSLTLLLAALDGPPSHLPARVIVVDDRTSPTGPLPTGALSPALAARLQILTSPRPRRAGPPRRAAAGGPPRGVWVGGLRTRRGSSSARTASCRAAGGSPGSAGISPRCRRTSPRAVARSACRYHQIARRPSASARSAASR